MKQREQNEEESNNQRPLHSVKTKRHNHELLFFFFLFLLHFYFRVIAPDRFSLAIRIFFLLFKKRKGKQMNHQNLKKKKKVKGSALFLNFTGDSNWAINRQLMTIESRSWFVSEFFLLLSLDARDPLSSLSPLCFSQAIQSKDDATIFKRVFIVTGFTASFSFLRSFSRRAKK